MSNWISVRDRLPEIGEDVLSYSEDEGIIQTKLARYKLGSLGYSLGHTDKTWFEYVHGNAFYHHSRVTHWMQLPEPPQP